MAARMLQCTQHCVPMSQRRAQRMLVHTGAGIKPSALSASSLHGLADIKKTKKSRRTRPACQARPKRRPEESEEEARERRLRESAVVESRVEMVEDDVELQQRLAAAGDHLVVVEFQSDELCESGLGEEAELQWREDQKAAQAKSIEACRRIKHTFQRTARDCPDVTFLSLVIPNNEEGEEVKERLGIDVLPTLQFVRSGRVLWQERGYQGMEQDMGEGVLYYGDQAAGGLKATEYVPDLSTRQEVHDFIHKADDKMLMVLNVSTTLCKPCIKIYPAVLALGRNFEGHAKFGRLMVDAMDEAEALLPELNILEVPTFIFYRGGKEVGRLVSSSRGDLIGSILQQQADAGIAPPPPLSRVKTVRQVQRQKSTPASRWR